MTLTQFIKTNKLKPADAVELVCPHVGYPKHYAVYVGNRNVVPSFIANISDGIQLLSREKLTEFIQRYQITNIERFEGNEEQRSCAITRGMGRIGEKAYNLVFNNCEHFKNWVLHGKRSSKQVATAVSFVGLIGGIFYLTGTASENDEAKKVGVRIFTILALILFFALALWGNSERENDLDTTLG